MFMGKEKWCIDKLYQYDAPARILTTMIKQCTIMFVETLMYNCT